jgi:eukaryotic translation initiation factor 2C
MMYYAPQLPMEVCKMIAQKRSKKLTDVMTSEMNAKTCTRPQERARHIHERAVAAEYHNDPYLREFKIACHPQLLEVEGRVLPPPRVQYGTRRMQQENNYHGLFWLAHYVFGFYTT